MYTFVLKRRKKNLSMELGLNLTLSLMIILSFEIGMYIYYLKIWDQNSVFSSKKKKKMHWIEIF